MKVDARNKSGHDDMGHDGIGAGYVEQPVSGRRRSAIPPPGKNTGTHDGVPGVTMIGPRFPYLGGGPMGHVANNLDTKGLFDN